MFRYQYADVNHSAAARVLGDAILALLEQGPLSRDDLVQMLEEPRTTILGAIAALAEEGKVQHSPERRPTRGRPRIFFYLAGDA